MLIVDDDVRNIFSLTSALEQHGMEVVFAENGREGIERLRATPDIDVMLVDIMMPEMDGYETMREIRSDADFRDLPIIAVTAKAMKGDREKCLEAGATDYVSKPVDIDQLLAVLRVQLGRSDAWRARTGEARGRTAPARGRAAAMMRASSGRAEPEPGAAVRRRRARARSSRSRPRSSSSTTTRATSSPSRRCCARPGVEIVLAELRRGRRCATCCTDDFAVILLDVQMPRHRRLRGRRA